MLTTVQDGLGELERAGVSEALRRKLVRYLQTAPPAALALMVPPRLAAEWGLDAEEMLEAFLQATRAGLLDLEWRMRCPSCAGPTQSEPRLDQVHSRSACGYCEIDFYGGFDDAVEVTWRVHPTVRDLSDVALAEVLQRHFHPQPVLPLAAQPGEQVAAEVELLPGNYHLFVPARQTAIGLRIHDGEPSEGRLEVTWDGARIERGAWRVGPGSYRLALENRSAEPVEMVLARVADLPWVSAAELASCQSFRDLFSSELIRPDDDFAIRSVDFVFTDLKGSTALYEKVGDSRAFALVRDHFEIMIELTHQHRGAIVKTIGDAIMATFLGPTAAIEFAMAVHDRFAEFNRAQEMPDAIVVKVGIHRGPCIAVNLNERIDYFGRTVNAAARIQGLSEGGDVVVSESYAADAQVREVLARAPYDEQPFTAKLKGIAGDVPLVRLVPRS
ncbi:MAG: adenylate/guanylate cyclase domain-containing protein [Deltaproteobacteria bacterium]|jgi:class 3 adenylate cyclase|nr:adenylate/guanylate cyclase domain-containing protein [Deltaproteobacteria bacterium]MBW2532807.1 adenylate/guanylate cyclase domain-containing protein [Deltaproteobacteria bacterium]